MSLSAVLVGCGLGASVALLVRALIPARPALAPALRRSPTAGLGSRVIEPDDRDEVWGRWLLEKLSGMPGLSLPSRDLELLGKSPARFMLSKVALAGLGLLAPLLVVTPPILLGLPIPFYVPTIVGLVAGGLLWFVPDLEVRDRAKRARQEFAHAMAAYLDLVALQRGADSGPSEALDRTSKVGDNWPFLRIRQAMVQARVDKVPPWDALLELTRALDLPALDDVAEIMRQSATDSAAVAETLRNRAESLRTQLLEEQAAEANADSEKMNAPGALLAVLVMVLIAFPAVIRILST